MRPRTLLKLDAAIATYKGMSARERLMLVIATAAGLYFAAEQLSFQPGLQRGQQLGLELSTTANENRALAALLAAPAAGVDARSLPAPASDAEAAERERLQQQALQLDQLTEQARENQDIHAWLRQITQGFGGVELWSIRVMGAMTLGSPGSVSATSAPQPVAPVPPAPFEIRPVELTLYGDYASLMGFLVTLEQRPGVRWVSTDLRVQQHPRSQLSLNLRVVLPPSPVPR